MKFRIDVLEGSRIALFSLRANRLRTVLTTVGVGIGVATLLAIIGIIQGMNAAFDRQLASIGSNSLYISKFPWVIKGDWWEYRNRKDFTLDQFERIRSQTPFATAMAPMAGRNADVSFLSQQLANVSVTGSTEDYLRVSTAELSSGRFLVSADNENRKSVAVIGMDVVDGLFPNTNPIGATIKIDGRPFQVVGVLARRGKILDFNQDLTVVVPFKTFFAYFGKRRGFSIGVAIEKPDQLDAAEDQLTGIVRRVRGTPPEKPQDFSINRPELLADTYKQLTGALYGVATGVGLITLLVGGIGIMNIMLVSVRERTREIGVRRALGARKRTIIFQFLMEAAAVSAIGGVLGTLVGLSMAKIISEITPLAATVNSLTVVGGIGFAAMVGLLFGIWPAARAANLDPVQALHYE
jgi:putative ABC transport system permease protein